MGLVEDTEGRGAEAGEGVNMLEEGNDYVVGDEFAAHSEEGVGVGHLFAWIDVHLYISYGFCFEQILIIVNIHLNYNNKSLPLKHSLFDLSTFPIPLLYFITLIVITNKLVI